MLFCAKSYPRADVLIDLQTYELLSLAKESICQNFKTLSSYYVVATEEFDETFWSNLR